MLRRRHVLVATGEIAAIKNVKSIVGIVGVTKRQVFAHTVTPATGETTAMTFVRKIVLEVVRGMTVSAIHARTALSLMVSVM